jgi:hypothetical protein
MKGRVMSKEWKPAFNWFCYYQDSLFWERMKALPLLHLHMLHDALYARIEERIAASLADKGEPFPREAAERKLTNCHGVTWLWPYAPREWLLNYDQLRMLVMKTEEIALLEMAGCLA